MKKLAIAASLAVTALSSSAMAGDWFVGIEGGKAHNEMSLSGKALDESFSVSKRKIKSNSYGIRVGKYVTDNIRLYGTYSKNKFSDGDVNAFNGVMTNVDADIKSQQNLMFSGDYVFMKDSAFRPFCWCNRSEPVV